MGKSAKILIRRMKSSIKERKGKCRISQKEIMNMFGRKRRKPLRQLITHKEPKCVLQNNTVTFVQTLSLHL